MGSLLHHIVQLILDAPSWLVLLVVGGVVFAEDAVFVGFLIPGETAAVIGGAAASLGHVPLAAVLAVVIVAAVLGDSVGYEVGRVLGVRLLRSKVLDSRRERVEGARRALVRRGGLAVFLGRWTAFLRAVTPALAGTVEMPYLRFLVWNALGAIVWGPVVVVLGYVAGRSYQQVEHALGTGTAVAAAVVVVGVLAFWQVRRHRRRRREREDATVPESG